MASNELHYLQEHHLYIRDALLKDLNYQQVATAFKKAYPHFTQTSRSSIARLVNDGKIWDVCTTEQRLRIENYIEQRSGKRLTKTALQRGSFLALRKIGAGND